MRFLIKKHVFSRKKALSVGNGNKMGVALKGRFGYIFILEKMNMEQRTSFFWLWSAALLAVAVLSACSDGEVAGNSAETGSPELAGILVLDGGKPAAHARVQCVPRGFDAMAEDVLPGAYATETDGDGRYRLDSIPTGVYALEAYHAQSGERLLVQDIEVTEDDSVAVSDTLRAPGVLKFAGTGLSFNEGWVGVLTVLGTTIRREVVVRNDEMVFDSLPAGSLELRIFYGDSSEMRLWLQDTVPVAPGDTETVFVPDPYNGEPEIEIPHDSVTMTFVAPLALPEGVDTLKSVVTDIPIAFRLTEDICSFDSLEHVDYGRFEAVRISKDGNRSKKLPISHADYDRGSKEIVVWVRVDSLNVEDSLEIVYDGIDGPVYARDVFPTNRSYSLVWHFGNPLSPMTDYSEDGYFDGEILGSIDTDAIVDGVVGGGTRLDSTGSFYVKKSAESDTMRKVDLTFDEDGYFCFSLWVQLESLEKEQTLFKKTEQYAVRFVPEKGVVVEWFHTADSTDAADTANYMVSWASGMDGIKAGEWTYVAFSRRGLEQSLFYINDSAVEVEMERSDWDGPTVALSYFHVGGGGLTGVIDELMVGGCYRDETWTRLTYLNQRPENYWPVLQMR